MKRTRVKAKEVSKLLSDYQINFSKKDSVELIDDKYKVIVVNKVASFFYVNDKIIPTLKFLQGHDLLKKVVVDMGAVKFMVNGADVMRPGIVKIDDGISEGDFVVVVDENNQKPLSVGVALLDSEQMRLTSKGKVIKNIHYVRDELWNDY